MNITRQQQLLSLIRRIVSTELLALNHERFHTVVVTDVLLSNDGREGRIYVQAPDATIEALNKEYRYELQRAFMKKYVRKVVPRLQFLKDTGEMERMDELLEEVKEDE